MGAMGGYGVSYLTGSAWLGVLAAAASGSCSARFTPGLCSLPTRQRRRRGHRDDAPRRRPGVLSRQAADPADGAASPVDRAGRVESRAVRTSGASGQRPPAPRRRGRLRHALFFQRTRWGLVLRLAGESADAARAMGYDVQRVRLVATAVGGAFAGVGRVVSFAVLPGQLERGALERPGVDGRRARDLREAGTPCVASGPRSSSAARARSVRRSSPWESAARTISSRRRRTSSRWGSCWPPARRGASSPANPRN